MKCWMIRNKVTGKHLPALYGRGATHAIPTDIQPPRLWLNKKHATQALTWWLKGAHERQHVWDETEEGDIICVPCPERKAEEWEVKGVTLTLTQRTETNANS